MQVRGVNTNVFWKNNDENIPSLTYLESIKNEMVEWSNTKVNFVNFTTIEIVSNNTKYDYIMFHDDTENIDKYFYYVATDVIANNKCVYTYFLDAVVTYLLPFMQTNNSKQFLTERSYILDKKTIQDTDTFVLNSPKNGTYEYDRAEYNFSNTPGDTTYVREYFEKNSNNSHESLRYTSPTNFTSEINGVLYMGFNALTIYDTDVETPNYEQLPSGQLGSIFLIPLLGYDNGVNTRIDRDNGTNQWVHPEYNDSNFKLEVGRRDKAPSDVTPLQTTTFRKVVTKILFHNGSNTCIISDFTNNDLLTCWKTTNFNTSTPTNFDINEDLESSVEFVFGFIKVSGDKNIPNRVLTWDEMSELSKHGRLSDTFNYNNITVTSGSFKIELQKNTNLNGLYKTIEKHGLYGNSINSNSSTTLPNTTTNLSLWYYNYNDSNWNNFNQTVYLLRSKNNWVNFTWLSSPDNRATISNVKYYSGTDTLPVTTINENSVMMVPKIDGNFNVLGQNFYIGSQTVSFNYTVGFISNTPHNNIEMPNISFYLVKESNRSFRMSFNYDNEVRLVDWTIDFDRHTNPYYDTIYFNKSKSNALNQIPKFTDLIVSNGFNSSLVTWTPDNNSILPFTYTQIYNTISFLSDIKRNNEAHFMGFFMLPHVFTFPSKSLKIMNLGVNYIQELSLNGVKYRTQITKYERNYLVLQIEPAGIDLTPFRLGSQNISVQPQILTYNNGNMWWYLYKFCETKFMNFNIDLSVYYYTNNDFVSNGWFIFAGQGIYVDKVDIYNLISSTWLLPGPLPSMTDEYRAYVNSNINSANAAYKNSVNHLVSGVFNAGATIGLGALTGGMSFAYSNKLINAAIGMNQNIINTNNTNGWINETFGKSLLAPGQKPLHYLKAMYNLKNVESYLKSAELSKTIGKQQVINGVEHATGGLFNSIVNLVNTRNNIKAQFKDARNRLGVSLSQSSADDAILESQWLNYQRHYNVVEKFIPDTDTIKNWNNIIYLYGFPGNRMMTFNQILNKPSDCIMHDCWYIGFNEIDLVQKLPLMETYNKLPNEIKDFIIEFLKKGVRFWDVNPTTIL